MRVARLRADLALALAFALGVAPAHGVAQQQPVSSSLTAAVTGAAPPRMSQAVRRGEVEVVALPDPHSGVEWGRGTAIVDAAPQVVLGIVTDYARYREFLPNFQASRVLSRRGNNAIVYLQARAVRNTTTLWAQLRIFQRRPRGQTQIIEGHMMQGNVARMDARWEVTPIESGARTLVTFQFLIDPDLPFPNSIVSEENRRVSRRTLESLRGRVADPRFAARPAAPAGR